MKILIIGATGFIGRELVKELVNTGHQVIAVSRNTLKAKLILGSKCAVLEWDGISTTSLVHHLQGCDAIINLAGENIAAGRWTEKRKLQLAKSRIIVGEVLSEAVRQLANPPEVILQGSATGFYGPDAENAAGEDQPSGAGFLAELTREWEASVGPAAGYARRMVWLRTGLVLGYDGGLLEKMLQPFNFYSGAVIGPGTQWMSWIHIRDEIRAIRFLLENSSCSGPFNLTAPNPSRMKDFIFAIGKEINRPVWLKVPAPLIKAMMGEMAAETVLASQNIIPGKLLAHAFAFEFPELQAALGNLLRKK